MTYMYTVCVLFSPAASVQSHFLVTASMQPSQHVYPLSANPQDLSVVVRDLQDKVKSLKATVNGSIGLNNV